MRLPIAGERGADVAADPSLSGDLLRFGFTPLYTRFVDAWDAAGQLQDILRSEAWRAERFGRRSAVT